MHEITVMEISGTAQELATIGQTIPELEPTTFREMLAPSITIPTDTLTQNHL